MSRTTMHMIVQKKVIWLNSDQNYNSADSGNKAFAAKKQPGQEESSCHLCGAFDPNFDEDTIMVHYYKECPMVIIYNTALSLL